ncbi:MAG: transposase family protein [Actinobacteria bacterium]|nr:transposase family protein [Actinomycetota bacterium]
MREKKALTAEIQNRYNKATKKTKAVILDEFTATTGYNRNYAARILRLKVGKVIGYSRIGGRRIKYIIGKRKRKKYRKPRIYTYDVFLALRKIWVVFDFICSKRLAPFMAEAVEKLEYHREIDLTDKVREKLTKISASTIDRLLKSEKDKFRLGKGRKGTKPGILLKNQIPVRTFADWDDTKPGFTEVDLVGHDGGNTSGDYIQSLNFVDIATCWDETAACKNKAQKHVFRAIKIISARFPFEIVGIDSDNGSEFINDIMIRYCAENKITFTRSRPYKKNDSCFVEQKNYSVVRRAVGYLRHDTEEELCLLNKLYLYLGRYNNFFIPVTKLISKKRVGSKVTKKYDKARTPFRRVLESEHIDDKIKARLEREYDSLNPVKLKKNIAGLQEKLLKLNVLKSKVRKEAAINAEAYGYIKG